MLLWQAEDGVEHRGDREIRRLCHGCGQLGQDGTQDSIAACALRLAPVVLGGEMIRERLEVHLLVAADRNDTPERRQRFVGE